MKQAEWALIRRTLAAVNGSRTNAAKLLGVSLRCLYYKIREMERHAEENSEASRI